MNKEVSHQDARLRAKTKFDFYVHAAIYVIVIAMLAAINLINSPGYLWVLWPAFGWGIGLGVHAAVVFMGTQKEALIDRLTERELNKQSRVDRV